MWNLVEQRFSHIIYILIIELYILCDSLTTTESTCLDGSCYNFSNGDSYSQTNLTYDEVENVTDSYEDYFELYTSMPQPMHIVSGNQSFVKNRYSGIYKMKTDICQCDLTVASCDINCCCDKDCNDFHLSVFSYCEQNETNIYDSRYCYKRNVIARNNTPFIHKKIADNLFCIVYDNLPPIYNPRDHLEYDLKLLKKEIKKIENKAAEWPWDQTNLQPTINVSNTYQHGDPLWKFQGGFLKPLEFAQTGFTSQCTFKKLITYLDDWKESCYQTNLSNGNKQLFVQSFTNFSVLSSPLLLSNIRKLITNQACPQTVCVPLTNYYCADSWDQCTSRESRSGFCSDKICENIVKEVKYLIRHNGTEGIKKITTFFKLANVSSSFSQLVEVEFKWIDFDQQVSVSRSGNPGYMFGKPIIIGTAQPALNAKSQSKYVTMNNSNRHLTLAYATKTGECKVSSRYNIEFGQNAKTGCSVFLRTTNFSTSSCQQLQNKTFQILLRDLALNSTDKKSRTFVLKYGDIFDNTISNWVQLLMDTELVNAAQGSVLYDEIQCEKMITSMKVHVLHSLISKSEGTNNHLILGIWVEFSKETTLSWPKCLTANCVDVLKVNVKNFVTFHDASKPSKYNFAVGPNVDISLPYDFFHPFVNNSRKIESLTALTVFVFLIIFGV